MALAVLDDGGETFVAASLGEGETADAALAAPPRESVAEQPFDKSLVGAVGRSLSLEPGGRATVTLPSPGTSRTPERAIFYATRFDDAGASLVTSPRTRSAWWARLFFGTTPATSRRCPPGCSTGCFRPHRRWHRHLPVVGQWAVLGLGGRRLLPRHLHHVWNYEHTMARLFPELERSVRQMQDFKPERALTKPPAWSGSAAKAGRCGPATGRPAPCSSLPRAPRLTR